MVDFKCQLLLVFGLLPLISYACVTLEEGGDGVLTCGSSNVASTISWELITNGIPQVVTTCSVSGTCQNFQPNLFQSEFTTSGSRKNNRMRILRVSKNQRVFRCKIDNTRIAGTCNIDVFVSPAKPTCSTPVVNSATSSVSLTCRTETVYPSALCVFAHRGDTSLSTLSGPIAYTTSNSMVSPGNRATECTITLPLSSLDRTAYNFKVFMRAQVVDTSKAHITESDYSCPFYPDPADEPQNAASQCQALSNTCATPAPQTVGTQICAAIEIGGTGSLTCGTTITNVANSIGFDLWQSGGFTNLSSCTPAGACVTSMPGTYGTVFTNSEDRVENRLQINSLARDQTIFKCAIDNRIGGVCEIQAYRTPARPTCDPPTMTNGNSQVSITCRTAQVYPVARCLFIYLEGSNAQVANGEITYADTQSSVDSCDRKTECTILIPAQSLPESAIRFAVRMNADVSSDSTSAQFSSLSAPFVVTP